MVGEPFGRRVRGRPKPQDLPPAVAYDQQTIEQSERDGRHDKEVHCDNAIRMVAKERLPSLAGIICCLVVSNGVCQALVCSAEKPIVVRQGLALFNPVIGTFPGHVLSCLAGFALPRSRIAPIDLTCHPAAPRTASLASLMARAWAIGAPRRKTATAHGCSNAQTAAAASGSNASVSPMITRRRTASTC